MVIKGGYWPLPCLWCETYCNFILYVILLLHCLYFWLLSPTRTCGKFLNVFRNTMHVLWDMMSGYKILWFHFISWVSMYGTMWLKNIVIPFYIMGFHVWNYFLVLKGSSRIGILRITINTPKLCNLTCFS